MDTLHAEDTGDVVVDGRRTQEGNERVGVCVLQLQRCECKEGCLYRTGSEWQL